MGRAARAVGVGQNGWCRAAWRRAAGESHGRGRRL